MALTMIACASTPKPIAIKKTAGTNLNYDVTWQKIISKLSADGMNIKNVAKDSGLITFEQVADPYFYDAYFDCGKRAMGSVLKPIALNIFVEKSQPQTKITVNLSGAWAATGMYGHEVASVTCYSTGKFEQELFSAVEAN